MRLTNTLPLASEQLLLIISSESDGPSCLLCVFGCSLASGSRCRRRAGKKRRPTVVPAHSLARHGHGLELLKVLRISTPTPRGQEAQLD
jgi:hypothetical protein